MLSEKFRDFFKENGTWQEPFRDYLFFGKFTVKTVHETLFLKDYEIASNFHVLGKEVKNQPEAEKHFENFLKDSEEILEIPPDHYLSSFALILVSEEEIDVSSFFKRKFLWFGLRGKVVNFGCSLSKNGLKFPKKAEKESPEFVKFLKSSFKASRGLNP